MTLRHLGAAALALAFVAGAGSAAHAKRYSPVRYCAQVASFGWNGRVAKCQPRVSHRGARSAHRVRDAHRRHPGGGLVTVKTAAGPLTVAARAASNFSGFVAELVGSGYRIGFMGGWRQHGSCRGCDMHPRGLAIDINQTGRNKVTRPLPAGVTEMAARHGLIHGAIWRNPDQGHFELAGVHHYAARAHARRFAHRPHRRAYAAAG